MAETITLIALPFSLATNVYLLLLLRHLKKRPTKQLDTTAQDLLHDLTTRGQAVLKVEVLDPSRFLLWRGQ